MSLCSFTYTMFWFDDLFSFLYDIAGTQKTKPTSISRTRQPIEAYQLLKHFLLLWKCTEVFKLDWSLRRLQVEKIDTPALHRLMRYSIISVWLRFLSVGSMLKSGEFVFGSVYYIKTYRFRLHLCIPVSHDVIGCWVTAVEKCYCQQ